MPASANALRDQVFATPRLLLDAFDEIERTARLILTTPEIYGTRRIVLVGSGDSFFAAKASEMALLSYSGLPIEVRPPLEAGRYHAMLSSERDLSATLVLAISNSGSAARVAEAADLYRRRGAFVLALTKAPKSRLARLATRTLHLPALPLPPAPGFGPYVLAIVTLLLIAIRIGEVRLAITMDEAQALRAKLKATLTGLGGVIESTDMPAREAAAMIAGRPLAEFVGAGPGMAVAEYGAAKVLEASGHHALARELEEWTHLNYFDAQPDQIVTILPIAADSVAQSRAVELLGYMHKLGRAVVVIGGGASADTARKQGQQVIAVDNAVPELWSPLLLSAPLALIAGYLADAAGSVYGRGGVGAWSDSADASTVQQGLLWEPGT